MAQLTVRQAALQVGVTRQTMYAMVADGRVSATVDRNGQKQIDTAELLRVFGEIQATTASPIDGQDRSRQIGKTPDTPATVAQQIEIERLRARLELREAELAMAKERIDELREREQAAHQERDKLFAILEQQTRMLAAPQPQPPTTTPAKKKKSGKKASTHTSEEEPKPPTGFIWPFWPRPL